MTGLSAEVRAPPVAAEQRVLAFRRNINNGGTLTDFCVIDGANVYRTKSVALAISSAREVATSMGARTLPRGAYWHCRDLPRGRKDSGSRGQSYRARRVARRQLFHATILGSQGRRTA
jgi:hypothetical protein